jgi:FAD-dependent oxidoreductase domain-containing protein 1
LGAVNENLPESDFAVKSCDVLVIGGGILGLSIAFHLKNNNRSKDVLLIDRFNSVAQGNTARSNAMFRNTFTSSDNIALADSSINCYLDIQNRKGIDIGLKECGYLWLMSERQLSANESHIRKFEASGVETKELDREPLKRLIPDLHLDPSDEDAQLMGLESVSIGLLGVKCGRIDPSRLANYFREKFLGLGGRILLGTNAASLIIEPNVPLGIEGEPFAWQESSVTGAKLVGNFQGEFRSKETIVAAGAWNNELLEPIGIDGHVKAKKRQLFTVSARGNEKLEKLLRSSGFNKEGTLPFVIFPKYACFLKAVEENHEFWCGFEDDFNRPFVNIPSETLDDLKAEPYYYERSLYPVLKSYFPAFDSSRPGQMWAGYYSYNTLDSIPFAFEENGLIVAGGASGSGIMKADALGRIVEALYSSGEDAQATLYGGAKYSVKKLGFKQRSVEREEWVL